MQFSTHSEKYLQFFLLSTVFAVGIFAYWPEGLFFLNDDFTHLLQSTENRWFQQNTFRPVADFSIWLNLKLCGYNALSFHWVNLSIHLINTLIIYAFIKKLFSHIGRANYATLTASVVASLFFIWAFHAEAIFWILGRASMLCLSFSLISWQHYLKSTITHKIISYLFFVLALCTYEQAIILPVMIVLVELLIAKQLRNSYANIFKNCFGFVVIILGWLMAKWWVTGELVGSYEAEHFLKFDAAILPLNWLKLIIRTWMYYPFTTIQLWVVLFVIILIGTACTVSKLFWREKLLFVLLCLIGYLPFLSLGVNTHNVETGRYLYWPSLFIITTLVVMLVSSQLKILFYGCWMMLIAYQSTMLIQSKLIYQVASSYSTGLLQAIGEVPTGKHIYMLNVPKDYQGALLFRKGLEDAVYLWHPSKASAFTITSFEVTTTNQRSKPLLKKIHIQEPIYLRGKWLTTPEGYDYVDYEFPRIVDPSTAIAIVCEANQIITYY